MSRVRNPDCGLRLIYNPDSLTATFTRWEIRRQPVASAHIAENIGEVHALLRRYEDELAKTKDLHLEDFRYLANIFIPVTSQEASM